MKNPKTTTRTIKFTEAFLYWFKLGFINFGGPAGQIAIMHHDIVEKKRWVSDARFLHALNFCMLLPGPEAQQLAIYIGWLLHRKWGGLIAGVFFILPSFFLLLALGYIYMVYGSVPAIAGLLYGVKSAVVAIIFFACYRIGARVLKGPFFYSIAAISFCLIFFLQLPFPIIVGLAIVAGLVAGHYAPSLFVAKEHKLDSKQKKATYVIDDHTTLADHTSWSKARFFTSLLSGLLIWATPMLALGYFLGWHHMLTQVGWFFTKAALLTFGGAYAVLPYVYQGAVDHYHWVSAAHVIDGLALGESTPGPLIMVITFVAFVAGWLHDITNPLLGACVVASVATFFMFLPGFIMIFLGAPLIESTRKKLIFTAPLTTLTAAVVGIIFNLALFFAYHVFWHDAPATKFVDNIDWLAVVLAMLCWLGLTRFKISNVAVIVGSGLVGMVYYWWRHADI